METVAKTIQSQATAPVNKTCSLKKKRGSHQGLMQAWTSATAAHRYTLM